MLLIWWLNDTTMGEGSLSAQIIDKVLRPVRETLSMSEYNAARENMFESLEYFGFEQRMSDSFDAVERYRERVRERWAGRTNAFEARYPHGFYTKDDDGKLMGLNIMAKHFIRDLSEHQKCDAIEALEQIAQMSDPDTMKAIASDALKKTNPT